VRIVVLGSSVYSETSCAMAVHLSKLGHVPVGALVVSTLNRKTLLRKIGQWGARRVARYARAKLFLQGSDGRHALANPYLDVFLTREQRVFRNLREVGKSYNFPVMSCRNQNSPRSLDRLRAWSPDLVIFTGGDILRPPLLSIPRLGVLNVHLGLLPEIRGMSSPEWSLLRDVPVGVTIHCLDAAIDAGPIVRRYELPDAHQCSTLTDLRNRLIAFGVVKAGDVVADLARGDVALTSQSEIEHNARGKTAANSFHAESSRQFFVMHEWLQSRAAERLAQSATRSHAAVLREASHA
jgi:methionyl-tRNA formyltransferase